MRKITWPDGYDFAFTIVDDTDGATVKNVKPVYDYLFEKGIITTKTCWVYPPRDNVYTGECLEDEAYKDFLLDLKRKGFEIGFHNAGSGGFRREETIRAFEKCKDVFGDYPKLHINHSNNIENIYWGSNRFSGIIKWIYALKRSNIKSLGHEKNSEFFWGDICKKHIKYIRNRTFNGINTLMEDPRLVYPETEKSAFSNYWFSSSDGMRLKPFLKLLTKENVDKLIQQKGLCIVYTHFAYDFVDEDGNLNMDFKKTINYIASKNGWFVPVSEILDYVRANKEYKPSLIYQTIMDIKWFVERIM